jgi:subtilisin
MATKKESNDGGHNRASASVEELLLAAQDRNDESYQTGRFLVTFKEGAEEESLKSLAGMRIADARDFEEQAATLESVGDADALYLPEIGVALISGDTAQERSLGVQEIAVDSPIESIDPEYFVFANGGYLQGSLAEAAENTAPESLSGLEELELETSNEYLRGFLRAAKMISRDLHHGNGHSGLIVEEEIQVVGATWGLRACKVPPSLRNGLGIKVAVLDTGFDLGHPDFVGRPVVSQTFVGQPVQDLSGHGTHMIGTACGPKAPAGTTPRYGIGHRSSIFAGKVFTNSGTGTMASTLTGMNWAISNRCPVILAPFAISGGPLPAYTAAGQAALNNGCLIIAGSASSGSSVGAPANSPTIISVAAVNQNLQPASFSPAGKIDIAAPGVDIFSSFPRPRRYQTWSGIASAAAHVAGCAALWAQTSPNLRGKTLWRKLEATALRFPPFFPPYPPKHPRMGAGLVQAP